MAAPLVQLTRQAPMPELARRRPARCCRLPRARKPSWLKVKAPGGPNYLHIKRMMRELDLHTVCEEARCPNIGECWEHKAATFMILGDVCTRNCAYCAVAHGTPKAFDPAEPARLADAVALMGLEHVVITSVDRDDLDNGGAEAFAGCITEIQQRLPDTSVEVLIPDFKGSERALRIVMDARPDILNHNLETAERLYRLARPGGRYDRALRAPGQRATRWTPSALTKSGIILGMGEEWDEIVTCLRDLRRSDVNIVTLGQYLRPSDGAPAGRALLHARGVRRARGDRHAHGIHARAGLAAHAVVVPCLGAEEDCARTPRMSLVDGRNGDRSRAPSARGPDAPFADQYRAWLRSMLLIRRFEEKAGEAYSLGQIGGFCHLYIGQEAVAVGTLAALRPDDYVISAYREHGQALARGITPRAVMAELFGKATGCSHGKGGSMHLFDAARHFMGGHGIVGGQIPLGAGFAFAAKYRGSDQVSLCYFGEAAANIGAFHETLNMAALWKLPAIFVFENNGYGMGTALKRAAAITELYQRAASYDMPGVEVDGQDVVAVQAGDRRRGGARPRRRRPDAARDPDLPLRRPLDVRRGQRHLPQQGRARRVAPARSDRAARDADARARDARRRRGAAARGRGRRRSRRRRQVRRGIARSPSRTRARGRDVYAPEADADGGPHLPRRAERGAPRRDAARRQRLPHGRGSRRVRRRLQGEPRPAQGIRRRAAWSTRRSPSWASPASASARRWSACGRSSSS